MNLQQASVLIVILNYATYDLTMTLVRQLHANLEYQNYEIMVVDNGSPNESAEVLKNNSSKLQYIFYKNPSNSGYAAGNNIGIQYGIKHGFAYTWILNNDVELRELNVLQHMVKIADTTDRIGCVGPKIFSLNGTPCAPYCRRPTFWSMTGGIGAEKKYRYQFLDTPGEVYRVYGCCMLLKNQVMQEIDCMDERTFLYGEEDILAERMRAKGYISYYDADVSVTHKESSTMKRVSKENKKFRITESKKSRELYLKEYRNYCAPARWLCHLTRSLITYFR